MNANQLRQATELAKSIESIEERLKGWREFRAEKPRSHGTFHLLEAATYMRICDICIEELEAKLAVARRLFEAL